MDEQRQRPTMPGASTTDVPDAATVWTYPNGLGRTVMADLVGYQVVATDGEIGHIDRATDDIDGAAIVVDTGFWIFGKQRMIPVGVIDRIDAQARTVDVRMTKDEIKHAPDFIDDPQVPGSLEHHRDELGAYYRRWWG